MNDNEILIIERINNAKADIYNSMLYVKENYGIDSNYDEDNGVVRITCESVDNALMLAAAKEYIEDTVGKDMINVVF
jgi:hypothetical protein